MKTLCISLLLSALLGGCGGGGGSPGTSALLRLSPSALLVDENDQTPITLYVYGGTAPYTARTSDLLMSGVSIDNTARTLTVAVGSKGSRCVIATYPVTITVVDSLGASAISIMTIQDNISGMTSVCP